MKICRDREITNVISSKCREIDQYINNLSDEDVMSEQDEKIKNENIVPGKLGLWKYNEKSQ